MKRIAVLLVLFLSLASPAPLLAKGPTLKIVIQGADLATPIEIRDTKVLSSFAVWSGLGTYSNKPGFDPTTPSFVIDWSQGATPEPSESAPRHEVLFYAARPNERLVYAVSYVFDAVKGEGYVYLPGKSDENYKLNVHTIVRHVEGKWFHSWSKWDSIAQQLIQSRRRQQSSTIASGK